MDLSYWPTPSQGPREGNHTLVLFLTEQLGFTQLFSEPSVFFKGVGDDFIAISVHVDDETIISRSLPPVISLKHARANRFGIDDLGETTYTLELEVQRDLRPGRFFPLDANSLLPSSSDFRSTSRLRAPSLWTQQQARRCPCS